MRESGFLHSNSNLMFNFPLSLVAVKHEGYYIKT